RSVTNRSSGKMGFAIVEESLRRGAEVILVAGQTALSTPTGARRIDVGSALEMHEVVLRELADATVVIKAAAVADFRPAAPLDRKIKKEDLDPEAGLQIDLVANPDILIDVCAKVAASGGGQIVIGFAAESHDVVPAAQRKLARKGCDLIVANDISRGDAGFNGPAVRSKNWHCFRRSRSRRSCSIGSKNYWENVFENFRQADCARDAVSRRYAAGRPVRGRAQWWTHQRRDHLGVDQSGVRGLSDRGHRDQRARWGGGAADRARHPGRARLIDARHPASDVERERSHHCVRHTPRRLGDLGGHLHYGGGQRRRHVAGDEHWCGASRVAGWRH
ncbi:MAG: phosphopantothenoylcysteine decarboxylase, partial [Deltaproteobacteria bacterium]|nr:phosphopantothenoylcysteine decarboxylase [Deltaproteobacteria bacterium]